MSELGTKYVCAECGARFYDLGKSEPVCPKCNTNQREYLEEKKASEAREADRQAALRAAVPDDEDEEEEALVDVDVDVLGDDEDDDLDDDEDDEEDDE